MKLIKFGLAIASKTKLWK